jgi:hypothetical protein
MDEVNFLQANPDIASTTRGARYTDDLILLVTSTTPQGVKQRVTEMSKKIYNSDLILKEDPQFIFNSAKYVGSHISANGNAMALNKNAATIISGMEQKIIRYPRWTSKAESAIKLGTCVGEIIRNFDSCTSTDSLAYSLSFLIKEFLLLGYPRNFIIKAIFKAIIARSQISLAIPNPCSFVHSISL